MTKQKVCAAVLPLRWDGKDVVCDHEPRELDPRDCDYCGATQCETDVANISLSLDGTTLVLQVANHIKVEAERGRQVYQGNAQMFMPRKVAKRLGFALVIASRFASGESYAPFVGHWVEAQ